MKIGLKIKLDTIYQAIIYIYICSVYFLKYQVFYIELIFIGVSFIRSLKSSWRKNFYLIWSIVLMLFFLLSFMNTINLYNSTITYIQLLKLFFLGNIIILTVRKEEEIQIYKRAIIIAGYFMIIYVLYKMEIPVLELFSKRFGSNKIVNSNDIALKLCVSTFFYIQIILDKKFKIKDIFFLSILIIFIFLTGSRKGGAFLLMGVVLEILFLKYKEKMKLVYKFFKFFPIIIIIFMVTIKKLYESNLLIVERFLSMISKENKDGSTLIRLEMIDDGIKFFKERIFFGYGLDNYRFLSKYETYSHNNYIELLVSVGIIGCIIYYFLQIYLIKNNLKYYKKYKEIIPFFIISLLLPIMDIGLVRYNDRFYNLIIVLNFIVLLKIKKKYNKKRYKLERY